jgi:prolyl-tRNA synthetase
MAAARRAPVLTPQAEDFPRWYQDVLNRAELADNGPVRGTMVIRPYGYGLWERMQAELDRRIKLAGAENAYFPLFIPESYLTRESEHVEGFSPELAVVTHGGGKKLEEALVVRPTSETVIGEYMAKWIQSYRDLPLLLNQWANVVRWELRPRVFLRTSEFLWQEGHTAHATREDAAAYAAKILHEVYADFMVNVLAIPLYLGIKPSYDRFAGAVNTLACEAMMRDGKALQMGTSHELGQNFARAFDILYLDGDNNQQHAWTTSWGASTRMVGGLIMAHGDDNGLRIPPALAHIQAVVVAVREGGAVDTAAKKLVADIGDHGVKVRLDDRTGAPYGRRITDWELKGVPVRVEVGPRELEVDEVTVVRRDTGEKQRVSVASASAAVAKLMGHIQEDMLAAATEFRDSNTTDATTIDEVLDAAATGFAKVPWGVVAGHDAKAALVDKAVTVRCIQRADGTMPDHENEPDLVAYCARSY